MLRVHQVADAPRRADHDVGAAAHLLLLRVAAHAAQDRDALHPHVGGETAQRRMDLQRQLAGRRQDQRPRGERAGTRRLCGEHLQDRQAERRGLAGAGRRDAEQVAPGEEVGNGGGLDRRRHRVAQRTHGTQDGLGQAELVEIRVCQEKGKLQHHSARRHAVDKEGCPIARSTRRDVEADTVAKAKFRRAAKRDRSHADRACRAAYRLLRQEKQALPGLRDSDPALRRRAPTVSARHRPRWSVPSPSPRRSRETG